MVASGGHRNLSVMLVLLFAEAFLTRCECGRVRVFITQIYVAFPRQPPQAAGSVLEHVLPLPPVSLRPRLADLYHAAALPATAQVASQTLF